MTDQKLADLERIVALHRERKDIKQQLDEGGLLTRLDAVDQELSILQDRHGLSSKDAPAKKVRMQRVLSADARRRMSEAQSRRWQKHHDDAKKRLADAISAKSYDPDAMVATVQGNG